jgi:uncharacterized protein
MKAKGRLLTGKIERLLEMFPAVAVVGPRQCGKSTLVQMVRPEWKYYDLERPDHYKLITTDPQGFLGRQREQTIIDEAQQFPELFGILRSVIDQDRDCCGRYLLTGSSSPHIVRELSESLAGRIATVELWPFKMAEFKETPFPGVYDLLTNPTTIVDQFADLRTDLTIDDVYENWFRGGYPEPRIKGQENALFHAIWMDEYFVDYVRRDIQRLFPRLNTHRFRLLIQSLSHYSGSVINRSVLARALEVSSVTIGDYLEILHETFVWRNLRCFDANPLKKVQKMPRGFFRDQGLLHHMLKLHDLDTLLVHPVAGRSFESFVTEEIIRGIQCTMTPGVDFVFYRTRDKAEIDLIIEGSFGIVPVEIKLGRNIGSHALRTMKSFLKQTDARFGLVVNNSDRPELLADNIVQIPAHYL